MDLFGVLNNVFGIQILSASGRSKIYSRMVFVSALITLLLITLLLQFCNATGVACAILLGEMFLSILLLKRYKNNLRNSYEEVIISVRY